MTPEVSTILELFKLGPAAVLIAGGLMNWYIWGPIHREIISDKDAQIASLEARVGKLEEIVFRTLAIAEKK